MSLNSLTDDLPEDVSKKLSAKLGGIFNKGKFSFGAFGISLDLDNTLREEKTVHFQDQIISSLSNLISEAVINAPKSRKFDGILIIIDEIQNIEDIREAAQTFKGIIDTLDFRERGYISFLLIGYSYGVENFFEGDPSARRSFDSSRLEVMPDKEAQEVLIKGFNKISCRYDEEILKQKINIAGGYPHALQILGQNLIRVDSDCIIKADDWEQAIERSSQELREKDFFDLYSFQEKQGLKETVMNIIALGNGDVIINKSSLSRLLGKRVYKHINTLLEKGSLKEDPTDSQLQLKSKLLAAAISFYLNSQLKDEVIRIQEYIKHLKEIAV